MSYRVISFLIAMALLFAGVLASSHAAATGGTTYPSQELLSADEQRSAEASTLANAETLADIPDLLVGPLVPSTAGAARPRVQPHAVAERVPPDLKGPLRPPSASGLPA